VRRPTLQERLAAALERPGATVDGVMAELGVSRSTVLRALRDRAERRIRALYRAA
jgi:transposase